MLGQRAIIVPLWPEHRRALEQPLEWKTVVEPVVPLETLSAAGGGGGGAEEVFVAGKVYVIIQDEVYNDSSVFLKVVRFPSAHIVQGTQSANPHNDYSQHYVNTGQRPQNFIRDSGTCL